MLVQILTSDKSKGLWYYGKNFQVFDVEEREDDNKMFYLTKDQLRRMKKATHLDIGILKEDTDKVGSRDGSDCIYNIENFLKLIGD